MKKLFGILCALVLVFGVVRMSSATITNQGNMFFDDMNGLYWYDPVNWATDIATNSETQVQELADRVTEFVTNNPNWRLPSQIELARLVASINEMNTTVSNLEQIIGLHISVHDEDGSYFWGGIIPAGVISIWDVGFAIRIQDAYGNLVSSETFTPLKNAPYWYDRWGQVGAWLVSEFEPVPIPPTASFTYSPENPYLGDTITFDSSGSQGEEFVSWEWDFGDDHTASGSVVTHSYENSGTYTVRLTITDIYGQTDSDEKVLVFEPITNIFDKEDHSREVSGASADGASEAIIQIKNVGEGDNITVVPIPEGDGTLIGEGTLSNGVFTQVYRAPDKFVRSQEDLSIGQRPANIQVFVNGQEITVPEFNLVKPPVVLLHGLWSNPSVWDSLSSKLINENGYQYTFSMPLNPAAHFDQNKLLLSIAIDNSLIFYKNLNLVAKKTDIVAHSMGGLLTKLYGQASKIRSITTVGTPHYGSPLADILWSLVDNDQDPFENLIAYWLKKSGHPARDGAVEDLRVNGGTHCEAGTINVPNYVISGISPITDQENILLINLLLNISKLVKLLPPSADLIDLNQLIFNQERNDWIVSELSQEGGLEGNDDYVLWHCSEPNDAEIMGKITDFIHSITQLSSPSQSLLSKSDEKLELINEMPTYEMPNSSGWVQITNPTNGQEFQPGDTVSISVEASDPNAMVLIATSTGESTLIESSPYNFNYIIPEDAVGQVSILVGATDDIGFIGSDEVIINVASPSNLTNITVYPDNNQLFLKVGTLLPLTVYGSYDDGIDRDITSLNTTQYTSSDPSIATVSETGMISVVSIGQVTITVNNSGMLRQLNIIARSLEDFDYDGDIDGSDLSIFLNAYAIGDLTADLDNNDTVDANDVGTFSGEFGKN